MISDHGFLTSNGAADGNSQPFFVHFCAIAHYRRYGADEYLGSVFMCKIRCSDNETCIIIHRPRDVTALTRATEPYVQSIKIHDPRQLTIHFTYRSVYDAHASWQTGVQFSEPYRRSALQPTATVNGLHLPSIATII